MKILYLLKSIFFITLFFCSSILCAKEGEPQEKESQAVNKNKNEEKETADKNNSKAEKKEEIEKPLKIGNLIMPPSQQPSPLLSFGQNIIDAKQMQGLLLVTDFHGKNQYFITLIPSILYAFTDDFSLFVSIPIDARNRQDCFHSSGGGDVFIQLEYAYYTKIDYTYINQATILGNVSIPTGSAKKNPPTGFGANSFFVGTTLSRMEFYWFYFVSTGAIFNCSNHLDKLGNSYLYQGGIGRHIFNTKDWLFAWMVEINGVYSWQNKVNGVIDPNSGGNTVYATPSLWISSENLTFQLGVGFPFLQSLRGKQNKNDYLLALNLGWTF